MLVVNIANALGANGVQGGIELGTFTTSLVDTNMTVTITKDANTDYNGPNLGPPAGSLVFDLTNYPTSVLSIQYGDMTFEKVVSP